MLQLDVRKKTNESSLIPSCFTRFLAFIEKNCHSNIESGVDNLVRRLDNYQTTKSQSKSDNKSKRQSCKKRIEDSPSFEEKRDNQLPIIHNEILVQQRTLTGKGFFFDLILFIGIAILILHIYLCYKLYKFDEILSNSNIGQLNVYLFIYLFSFFLKFSLSKSAQQTQQLSASFFFVKLFFIFKN